MKNPRLKILFVCAMIKQRSATAERLFRMMPALMCVQPV
jgi:predicted protein tyrosine phosphatase